jgi:hypothetical protein
MNGVDTHSEGPGQPINPATQARPSSSAISSILGVFAGTGRGALIGGIVGTCVCFLVMMTYLGYDLATGGVRGLTPGAVVATLVSGAAWLGAASLIGGGSVGAFLGAMVGAFFPIRRGPR